MSDPFVAEIKIFAGNFAPRGWSFCEGQLLPISQNTALFSLIGTTYGGDGRTTTGLPNLKARAPMHPGNGPGLTNRRLGDTGGVATVTLIQNQLPNHTHATEVIQSNADNDDPSSDRTLANSTPGEAYHAKDTAANMAPQAVSNYGNGQAHNNLQPYLSMYFIIALVGTYPSRS